MEIVIFADSLEKEIIDILKTYDCHVVEKRLDVADFIPFEDIGVERKQAGDFVQSIIDGRLFEQVRALRECFERPLLLIEGNSFTHPRCWTVTSRNLYLTWFFYRH